MRLRLRRDGRLLLGTLPPVLRDFVHAFAAGQPGWDSGIESTDVTLPPPRRRMVPYLVAILVSGALPAALVSVLPTVAAGTSP